MRRQITELSTLAEVSKTLTSPLYLEEMLGVIAEMATRLMHADRCAILLVDQEAGHLVPTAAHGADAGAESDLLITLAEGALHEGHPAAVADLRERMGEASLRAVLAVPLTVREKGIGVFLASRHRVHHWSAEEVERLSTLAHQTALAIENSTLVVRTAVVREMHHRVKNNLQTIAMLLRLQLRGERPVSGREVLTETVNRILSIAAVHEILSVEGFRMINVRELVDRVAQTVAGNMVHPPLRVAVEVTGDDLYLPSQPATSLALAVNELVQNALEHAFPDRMEGRIAIRLGRHERECFLEVRDDGVGLADQKTPGEETLGLQIVRALATQDLGGRFDLESGGGTRVTITFPAPEAS
jgi:two-component sensor histidine kinase